MAFLGIWAFLAGEADKLILGIYLPAASVGVYSVALTIAAFIPMLLTSVNSIFAPTIANLYAKSQHVLLEQLLQTLTKWIFGLTVPLIAIVLLFAPELMGIFGKDFQVGGYVLAVVALGQLVNVSTGPVGMMLWMSGHESVSVKSQIVASLVSLSANLLLIPVLGIMGAAIAQLLGLVITNVIAVLFVSRKLKMCPYNRGYFQLLMPTLISLGVIALWRVFALGSLGELKTMLSAIVTSYSLFVSVALSIGLDSNERMMLTMAREQLTSLVRLILFRG
jgi:O-antigen/teichoic acid export membrane protein